MSYVALYRKYRSQSFDELMGQEAVTTVLRNSLASGRFGHAYLFHGARGCGKTSTARLLARALNCVAQDGPTPDPCGTCRLCVAIRDGACMDVIEMDAASETGIDDVREKVIENVQYAPGEARFKVYIIDEVHDLSSKAFDALLKTLEEPPAHVVFVLATTEYHKVPVTIRSRCQGFQFKRGTLKDLGTAVDRVVKAEGYSAEPEAIEAIARSAEGSWRDALSILEQVLAYSDGHVTADIVHRAVGTVGIAELARVTETLARGDLGDAIDVAGELLDRGTDARQLLTTLQGHLRDLMLLTVGAKRAAQDLGPDRLALLQPQAGLFTSTALMAMMSELSAGEKEVRFSNHHRWILERTLARMQAFAQGAASIAPAASAPILKADAARNGSATRPAPITVPLAATPAIVPKPQPSHIAAPTAEEEEEEVDTEVVMAAELAPPVAPVASTRGEADAEAGGRLSASATDHRFADEVTLEVIQRAWPRILKTIEKVSPPAKNFLEKAQVKALTSKLITLSFLDTFARDRIQTKGKELVEKKVNEGLKTEGYKILCVMDSSGGGGSAVPAAGPAPTRPGGDTGTLLDTPATPVASGPARIMDFDMPTAPLPSADTVRETTTARVGYDTAPPTVAESPASNGLLAETLKLFGGEVVKTEPINPSTNSR